MQLKKMRFMLSSSCMITKYVCEMGEYIVVLWETSYPDVFALFISKELLI